MLCWSSRPHGPHFSCVRTIVVWKRKTPHRYNFRICSCVRTIVVWKHETRSLLQLPESQGCVRTIVVWKHNLVDAIVIFFMCCVRTIVVWKRGLPAGGLGPGGRLRKNHSGMNCCLRQDAVPGRSSREVMRRRSSADAMPGEPSGTQGWLRQEGEPFKGHHVRL